MTNRHRAQVASSPEENAPPSGNASESKRIRKKLQISDEEAAAEATEKSIEQKKQKKKQNDGEEMKAAEESDSDSDGSDEEEPEVKPVGEAIRVSGKGRGRRSHYKSFEHDGNRYELEDSVLLVPESLNHKPYVAIIKDISQVREGALMITGQWFYRPEEAEKEGGGYWVSQNRRELYYSFHRDDVPAGSVMHKCIIYYLPVNKQIPDHRVHPGFIVQKVYDIDKRKLFKLTDKDYEDSKQHEIDSLLKNTRALLGDLPELEPLDAVVHHEDQMNNKRLSRKRFMTPLDVSGEEEGLSRSQSLKADTPGSTGAIGSEYLAIMSKFCLLTSKTHRDKWLEKLLQSMQIICSSVGSKQSDKEEQEDASVYWPDTVASVVAALEKAAHDTLSADFQKYNQKMRQLTFNLKSNGVLARRLLSKELEPAQILDMSPNELKEGLTAEEIASREPEEADHMQMTDARCERCSEKQVGLKDIIHTGHEDRYQLECIACGNRWYASRDAATSLTTDAPSSAKTVKTAPLESDDFEKNLGSPHGAANEGANDVLKKATEANMPVLDKQRSVDKTRVAKKHATGK